MVDWPRPLPAVPAGQKRRPGRRAKLVGVVAEDDTALRQRVDRRGLHLVVVAH
eukprot:SAG22_NODE_15901_length_337_cov_1.079832_1_plen_52_part_10